MTERTRRLLVIMLGLLVMGGSSCRYQSLRKKLDPENAELLSKVKYLITPREQKLFLDLPDEEKPDFWMEFWKKRDPTPDTEENELKQIYFERIDEADQAFKGEGRPGWMTDRGRIYILYGPPTNVLKSPMGTGRPMSECREVWYYGNFPVVFQDATCTGEYRLMTFDLTPISSLNINRLGKPGADWEFSSGPLAKAPVYLDFEWEVTVNPASEEGIRGSVRLMVPYSRIWFIEENGMLSSTFGVILSIQSNEAQVVWEKETSFPVVLSQEELKSAESKQVDIDIPFVISEYTVDMLGETYMISLTLTNRTDGSSRTKEKPIDFEDSLSSPACL